MIPEPGTRLWWRCEHRSKPVWFTLVRFVRRAGSSMAVVLDPGDNERRVRLENLYRTNPRDGGPPLTQEIEDEAARARRGAERAKVAGMSESKTPAKAAKAEAKSSDFKDLTCTCGQVVSTEDAAEKHREQCAGQWLAEAEPATA